MNTGESVCGAAEDEQKEAVFVVVVLLVLFLRSVFLLLSPSFDSPTLVALSRPSPVVASILLAVKKRIASCLSLSRARIGEKTARTASPRAS